MSSDMVYRTIHAHFTWIVTHLPAYSIFSWFGFSIFFLWIWLICMKMMFWLENHKAIIRLVAKNYYLTQSQHAKLCFLFCERKKMSIDLTHILSIPFQPYRPRIFAEVNLWRSLNNGRLLCFLISFVSRNSLFFCCLYFVSTYHFPKNHKIQINKRNNIISFKSAPLAN